MTERRHSLIMRSPIAILLVSLLAVSAGISLAQDAPRVPALQSELDEQRSLLERVIANQKKDDLAQFTYERIERLEVQKSAGAKPEVKATRAVPAGTGIDRIPVGPDGKPADAAAYRAELEKLERTLSWAAQDGRAQREAYEKITKKQKERADLINATRNAFIFTFITLEPRGDRTLSKYSLVPNPAYKATSRATAMFSKVRGYLWIDEDAAQLARAELEVTDDISIGRCIRAAISCKNGMRSRPASGFLPILNMISTAGAYSSVSRFTNTPRTRNTAASDLPRKRCKPYVRNWASRPLRTQTPDKAAYRSDLSARLRVK